VLHGVVSPAVHVFEAPLDGDRLGGIEPRAGVRDEADSRRAPDPPRPRSGRRRRSALSAAHDPGTPDRCEFARDRAVQTRERCQTKENQGQHRYYLSHSIARSTLGDRPSRVKARLRVHMGRAWLALRTAAIHAIEPPRCPVRRTLECPVRPTRCCRTGGRIW